MLPTFGYINERQINTGYVNTNNLVHLTNGLHGPMENRQTQLDNRYYIEQMYGDGDNMATERGGGEEGVGGEMSQGNWMWGRGQGELENTEQIGGNERGNQSPKGIIR